jgi:hypothetical protein
MARHSLTYEQADAKVVAYEDLNADVPQPLRRLLALFTIARATTRGVVAEFVGYDSAVPFRDYSRRWWLVLSASGLGRHWEGFRERGQNEGLTSACKWLRREVTPEQWKLFKRRAGVPVGFRLWNRSRKPKGDVIWTKGGCWDRKSSFTRLLVLKEPLPERPAFLRYQRRLGPDRVRLLERELMHMIDPDQVTVSEAKQLAVDYVRSRIAELVGPGRDQMGPAAAAWFFQQEIPVGDHRYVGARPARARRYPITYVDRTRRRQRSWA